MDLGGKYLQYDVSKSSIKKGESIQDTIRNIENYADILVIRHDEPNIIPNIDSNKILINAGDGYNEHPTQALIDLFTIYYCNNFKQYNGDELDNFNITLIGDLKYSRTINSLIKLLLNYRGVTFNLVSPRNLMVSQSILELLKLKNCKFNQSTSYKEFIRNTDVVYMTRVQGERFDNKEEYEKVKDFYCLKSSDLVHTKENMIIMHPLPRLNEISTDVDTHKCAKYFLQSKLGLYVRMALLMNLYYSNLNMSLPSKL